jgi:glyoxylase-like metal-dependent hydrolase (beta-lactamase superfamily II)
MITVKRLVCNMLQENTYIVSDETREAVVIDCGAYYDAERRAIVNYLNDNRLKPVHLLCTHGHFDHNFGNDTIWHTFGLKPEVAAEDEGMMELKTMFKDLTGADYQGDIPPVGRLLTAGECISFGTHELKVLPTPGHSRGSVTFYCEAENAAFTGDTLFRLSIGRTDFEGGSWDDMSHSLKRVLAALPADTTVYPGHGEPTTIGYERQYNPYMR